MNRWSFHVACGVFLAFSISSAVADDPTFAVVGKYDGSKAGNTVDRNAAFFPANSMGVGADKSLVIGIGRFRSKIKAAFSNGCGGVVNFDNGLIAGGSQTDSFVAKFGKKALIVKNVDDLRTDFIATNVCTAISGPGAAPSGGFLAKSNVDGDQITIRSSYNFSFTEQGFASDEHVTAVGGTILGRNGSIPSSKWLMMVRLDNDDVIAEMADINCQTGNARDDTFFGAVAPAGRYITGVSWLNLSGTYSGLDGFAFWTNGRPSEPNTPAVTHHWETPSWASTNNTDSGDEEDYTSLFGSSHPH